MLLRIKIKIVFKYGVNMINWRVFGNEDIKLIGFFV